MVFIARFPSLKRFYIHMPVGRRLPMYCTASGRAYLAALPRRLRCAWCALGAAALTALTLTDPKQILKRIQAAREAGYAWSDQECYRGDVTIAAAVLGEDGQPLAAVNISAPTSRWTLAELRSEAVAAVAADGTGRLARARAAAATLNEHLKGNRHAGAQPPLTAATPHHHDLDRRDDRARLFVSSSAAIAATGLPSC